MSDFAKKEGSTSNCCLANSGGENILLSIHNIAEFEHMQEVLTEFFEKYAPGRLTMFLVAVNEAINNGLNAGKNVYLKLCRRGGRLLIRVKDDGPGFNIGSMNCRFKSEEEMNVEFEKLLLGESGRGILMMKLYCDLIIYNSKGNEVLLMKKL